MLPRKRPSEGVVVEEVGTDSNINNNNSSSNNSGSGGGVGGGAAEASFHKKNRIGCFAACSRSAGGAESTVNDDTDRSFGAGSNDNNNSSGVSDMALGDSKPPEIDEDLHSRQLAVYGRETMRKLVGSSVLSDNKFTLALLDYFQKCVTGHILNTRMCLMHKLKQLIHNSF